MAEAAPGKLSLVVQSADFGKVHYAFVIAAAAAAIGRPVTLFFTMEALNALRKAGPDGRPGWRAMAVDGRPGAAGARDDGFAVKGVATFEELLSASVELGVRFMVCDMGLRALGLEREDLRPDVPVETGGVVTFLNDARADGAMLFV